MGVLGWTPETVMREASLAELHDAWLGYAERHGLTAAPNAVTAVFLEEMLRRFPDARKNNG